MAPNFKEIITGFAEHFEWETDHIDDESAQFTFEAESGDEQILYINLNEDVIEFDVPSAAVFATEDEIPDETSTLLLKRNALLSVGAWVLEEIEDQWCFSLMWNEGLGELETLDQDEFGSIISTMIEECDEFDRQWAEDDEA